MSQHILLRIFITVFIAVFCFFHGIDRYFKLAFYNISRLNAAGLPLDQIRANLGHASLTTTLRYIYNPLTPEESLKLMEKAFDD